uniref:Uncharacterized protein n=1 Tax=Timema bartmani TaxID=61472 RepID=A0A7R9FA99_9NEOP|nr:unnamed protein product [Timema bartmani]
MGLPGVKKVWELLQYGVARKMGHIVFQESPPNLKVRERAVPLRRTDRHYGSIWSRKEFSYEYTGRIFEVRQAADTDGRIWINTTRTVTRTVSRSTTSSLPSQLQTRHRDLSFDVATKEGIDIFIIRYIARKLRCA